MLEPLKFATQLAQQTGKLLLELYSPFGTPASLKEDQTIVTDADTAADRLIRQAIREGFPKDRVISEEINPSLRSESNSTVTQEKNRNLDEKAVWVIDPLDGTTNFSLGLHYWGISIARILGGYPEIATIYFPLINELYTAQKGKGAFLNSDRIYAKQPQKSHQSTFFSCCSRTHKYYDVRVRYKTRILGSAAYDLCTVARGVSVLGFEATPKIWDIAASWLIVEEAGGVVETYDGSKPFPLETEFDFNRQVYPTLAAANQAVLAKGRTWIKPRS